jgi:hypothetical protein
MTQWFFFRSSLACRQASPPCGDSPTWRSNRPHMPNPQLGVVQPTQDGDPQATRNLIEMPFVIFHG